MSLLETMIARIVLLVVTGGVMWVAMIAVDQT
jgi:hypothetical protein